MSRTLSLNKLKSVRFQLRSSNDINNSENPIIISLLGNIAYISIVGRTTSKYESSSSSITNFLIFFFFESFSFPYPSKSYANLLAAAELIPFY